MKGIIIAIDGPVASGKGTIAPQLARELHGFYIYTGGTYRALALYCLRNGIDVSNEEAVSAVVSSIEIDLVGDRVLLNNEDITEEIKKSDVANAASPVSAFKKVRETLVSLQQEIGRREKETGNAVVAEGRDTATVVFPDADLKIFLTANEEVRAQRRMLQYEEKGENLDFEKVLEDVHNRDERDTHREVDPLVENPQDFGYFIVDNSTQNEDETIGLILDKLKRENLL